ncbi:MAG: CoA activase, partial [Bacteroidia bacterium]
MILSIDIGSVAVSIVIVTLRGEVVKKYYDYHHGKAAEKVAEILSEFSNYNIAAVVTPSESEILSSSVQRYNLHRSVIEAAKYYYSDMRALLHIGAARFQLMHFNGSGEFTHSLTSTSCAAGTGSFLDQQAKRLEMDSISSLTDLAEANRDPLPEIASRCSVFAKTDLIHAQQAGYSLSAICDSLCRGLARNIADTLFDDLKVPSEIVFTGGVSMNGSVKRHLSKLTGSSFRVHEHSHLFPAIGAALLHLKKDKTINSASTCDLTSIIASNSNVSREYVYEPLDIRLSDYPDFNTGTNYIFTPRVSNHQGKVQVEIFYDYTGLSRMDCYLGIDIGSTSTKAIIIDSRGEPVAGFYTYTHGQPLNATRAILESVRDLGMTNRMEINVLSCSTTGSGRKYIGSILGADMAVDEITTHARAAVWLNPKTDTIIEIGGQDAKFTCLRKGNVTFSKMNSVCAAGTGSFIEEQANKLGVSLDEYSSLAENSRSPLA